ncbi:MAG: pilus assembly PilX N-terminal domain-containing protein [Candidatus Acidiferrales bacterium]
MKNYREKGIALVTALLVLMLVSSIIVSIAWLVMTDQKLGGNNSDHEVAFYGAEAGMEAITSQLAAKFDANYALSGADITTIQATPPNDMPVQFLNPDGTNGYDITYPVDKLGNPAAANHTIVSGPYAGLVGLLTPYTLTVTARTPQGSEVKLTRLVQTAAIPVFQFGIFSDTDLSFFAGPDFDFGGRVHTNGNLWLAENGGTLTLEDKVTAAGEVIRTNLQNGQSTTGSYNTTVNITTNPGSGSYASLTTSQGSTSASSTSWVGNIATSYWAGFPTLVSGTYHGDIGARETGVSPLNLGIATPSIGGQAIDLIRLPLPGESGTNPAKLAERYYSQASVRILLADYGPSGTCTDSSITTLPMISPGVPVDLAKLAWDTNAPAGNANNTLPYSVGPVTGNPTTGLVAVGPATGVYPLPVSGATNNVTYSNGYWQKQYYPVITGCLKVDYQTTAGGAFLDITWPVLNQGFTGRNIDPDDGTNGVVFVVSPSEPGIPTKVVAASGPTINAGVTTIKCTDPSPNAIIRFARLRDNPSNAAAGNKFCGTGGVNPAIQHGTDYWPNVLWDTREGNLRDTSLGNANVTFAGAMHYVELDVANLAKYLSANAGVINNVTGYTLYFSDRRGDVVDPNAPPSTGGGAAKTGAYGFDDIVNLGNANNGCPNGILDQGEDLEGDYTSGVDPTPILRTYGNVLFPAIPANLWPIYDQAAGAVIGTNLGSPAAGTTTTLINNIAKVNATCPGPGSGKQYPYAFATNPQDLRENPPIFFRRSLKIVDGSTLSIGVCDGVPCGLSIISENPVYVQGDYNDPTLDATFATGTHAASSIMADAVTLLSDNWNDVNSFASPYTPGNRSGVTTMYRMAIVAGKGIAFKNPGGANGADYGTDGGVHNFLRYLESWGGTLDYHGSIVSFYYDHQATGTYKCCNTVYSPPTRGYKFDSEFLSPSLLPPKTPMLRSINTIGFTQETLPTQ